MKFDKEEIISSLNLNPFGSQGWLANKQACPFCGKSGKWGVIFTEQGGVFHCWKCGKKVSLFLYLKEIGRKDLCRVEYQKTLKIGITPIFKEEEIREEREDEVVLPKKLIKIDDDEYLNSRGFLDIHYKEFEPSYTNYFLESDLFNYIVFKIKQKGKIIAWLARSRYSKEWHKENLERAKQGKEILKLRYRNSESNFNHFIGGYDMIYPETKTIILVEGLFDKVNIDRLLNLDKNIDIACCCTFGNSVSKEQINLLREKHINNIILMYDPDALIQSKDYGVKLSRYFNTQIALIKDKNIDPGNMDLKYLNKTLSNLETPFSFYTNYLHSNING